MVNVLQYANKLDKEKFAAFQSFSDVFNQVAGLTKTVAVLEPKLDRYIKQNQIATIIYCRA